MSEVVCVCGKAFAAKSNRARTARIGVGSVLSVAAVRRGRAGGEGRAGRGLTLAQAGPVETATVDALKAADRLETPHGAMALSLARRMDEPGLDTGSALAAVSRRNDAVLAVALRGAGVASAPQQLQDENRGAGEARVTEYAPLFRHRPPERWTNGDLAAKVGLDLGLPPDDEQRELLDMIYAEKAPDQPTAFEVCGSVRGRTSRRQRWVSRRSRTCSCSACGSTVVGAFGRHCEGDVSGLPEWIGRNPDYDDACRFYEGHQDRSIVHEPTGNRIDFGSRTGKGKRGLTGVQRVTLDEALYPEPKHVGAVYPTMLTRPGAQVRGVVSRT